ncbi:MAG TPA: hypothetical protein VNW15_01340 [Rhizomicrobium sp.]|nr:hypothetical protein [Rhizomicrobium sp.]
MAGFTKRGNLAAKFVLASCGLALPLFLPGAAYAVPSYARQTGLACEACHTVFPQLTPFGRVFKASGYTLSNTSKVQDVDRLKHYLMSLSDTPPISVMVEASTSSTAKASDSQSSKTSTDLPQQFSVFYAGAISDNVGAFLQVTYDDQSGSVGIDNTDIRFADVTALNGHSFIYGLSLNNNPTVQDLWNSTPAWGQPFLASPVMAGPAASTRIEGAMAQSVAGLSAYVFADQSIYGEVGVYRSALQGASVAQNGSANNDIISGVAPYWRLAYEADWGQNSWELGTFGLDAALQNPTSPALGAINDSLRAAPTDRFFDVGVDTQYQFITDDSQITVVARAIKEHQRLNASFPAGLSDNPSDFVNSANLVASYFWRRKIGATIGIYGVSGSSDATYFGSQGGRPDSSWGNVEVDYLPWLNVKLGLQYTAYMKFNGATSNYDGAGRNASDNNLIFGYLWVAY